MNPRSIGQKAIGAFKQLGKNAKVLTMVSAVAILAFSLCVTGLSVFTNQVFIVDGENVSYALTTSSDAAEILAEKGIEVGEDDVIVFDGFEDNTGRIEILRAFDVNVTS